MMIAAIGTSLPIVVMTEKAAPTRFSNMFISPIARIVIKASGIRQLAPSPKKLVIKILIKPATDAMIAGP